MKSILATVPASLKSLAKVALQSRPVSIGDSGNAKSRLLILGNGPSLRTTIENQSDYLKSHDSMAVNFAANTPEFRELRPKYYILMDPVFFSAPGVDSNVDTLWHNLKAAEWDMTLIVPRRQRRHAEQALNGSVRILTFNDIGLEGHPSLTNLLYRLRLGMPRPRNVLIPAIMCGLWLGYKDIEVFGADHSWMQTLSVTDDNCVVSVQPHFYSDNEAEKARVTAVYRDIPLHSIVESFAIAFRGYHSIAGYARRIGANITNRTPGSMIDAFPRRK